MTSALPVTPEDPPLPPREAMVSTTDLQGRITSCNPAFMMVSGYQREELLGQPHRLVRHPDMPREVFRDMWATLSCGRPWSAPVKNQRKDGSAYWVMAYVAPLMSDDAPSGYIAICTRPERARVQKAEAFYATMRAEGEAGHLLHRFEQGRLVVGLRGRIAEVMRGPRFPKAALLAALACLAAYSAGWELGRAGFDTGTTLLALGAIGLGLGGCCLKTFFALTNLPPKDFDGQGAPPGRR